MRTHMETLNKTEIQLKEAEIATRQGCIKLGSGHASAGIYGSWAL
jgi:hypothetical protein